MFFTEVANSQNILNFNVTWFNAKNNNVFITVNTILK